MPAARKGDGGVRKRRRAGRSAGENASAGGSARGGALAKMRFVVTAGPTREYLDPVRFLSNPSTGKMGFAVAKAAAEKGYEVVLIAGPVALKTPRGVKRIDVVSARDMLAAVRSVLGAEESLPPQSEDQKTSFPRSGRDSASPMTVLISTAAIADWRPAKRAPQKLKKAQMTGVLKLVRNPDILKSVKGCRKVGFAAETNAVEAEARRKCRAKQLEFIVANDVTEPGCGFGTDTNRVMFLRKDGSIERLPLLSKLAVARRIVRECEGW